MPFGVLDLYGLSSRDALPGLLRGEFTMCEYLVLFGRMLSIEALGGFDGG